MVGESEAYKEGHLERGLVLRWFVISVTVVKVRK